MSIPTYICEVTRAAGQLKHKKLTQRLNLHSKPSKYNFTTRDLTQPKLQLCARVLSLPKLRWRLGQKLNVTVSAQ
jgi:hypothetical protein